MKKVITIIFSIIFCLTAVVGVTYAAISILRTEDVKLDYTIGNIDVAFSATQDGIFTFAESGDSRELSLSVTNNGASNLVNYTVAFVPTIAGNAITNSPYLSRLLVYWDGHYLGTLASLCGGVDSQVAVSYELSNIGYVYSGDTRNHTIKLVNRLGSDIAQLGQFFNNNTCKLSVTITAMSSDVKKVTAVSTEQELSHIIGATNKGDISDRMVLLTKDIVLNNQYSIDGKIGLDLNGHKITAIGQGSLSFVGGHSVIVNNADKTSEALAPIIVDGEDSFVEFGDNINISNISVNAFDADKALQVVSGYIGKTVANGIVSGNPTNALGNYICYIEERLTLTASNNITYQDGIIDTTTVDSINGSITLSNNTLSKNIPVTIVTNSSIADILTLVATQLGSGYLNGGKLIDYDLYLPTSLIAGGERVSIKWKSDKPHVISNSGKYYIYYNDIAVTLLATITSANGSTDSVRFELTAKGMTYQSRLDKLASEWSTNFTENYSYQYLPSVEEKLSDGTANTNYYILRNGGIDLGINQLSFVVSNSVASDMWVESAPDTQGSYRLYLSRTSLNNSTVTMYGTFGEGAEAVTVQSTIKVTFNIAGTNIEIVKRDVGAMFANLSDISRNIRGHIFMDSLPTEFGEGSFVMPTTYPMFELNYEAVEYLLSYKINIDVKYQDLIRTMGGLQLLGDDLTAKYFEQLYSSIPVNDYGNIASQDGKLFACNNVFDVDPSHLTNNSIPYFVTIYIYDREGKLVSDGTVDAQSGTPQVIKADAGGFVSNNGAKDDSELFNKVRRQVLDNGGHYGCPYGCKGDETYLLADSISDAVKSGMTTLDLSLAATTTSSKIASVAGLKYFVGITTVEAQGTAGSSGVIAGGRVGLMSAIAALPSVTHIDLSYCGLDNVTQLTDALTKRQYRSINLRGNTALSDIMPLYNSSTTLENLDIAYTNVVIETIDSAHFNIMLDNIYRAYVDKNNMSPNYKILDPTSLQETLYKPATLNASQELARIVANSVNHMDRIYNRVQLPRTINYLYGIMSGNAIMSKDGLAPSGAVVYYTWSVKQGGTIQHAIHTTGTAPDITSTEYTYLERDTTVALEYIDLQLTVFVIDQGTTYSYNRLFHLYTLPLYVPK